MLPVRRPPAFAIASSLIHSIGCELMSRIIREARAVTPSHLNIPGPDRNKQSAGPWTGVETLAERIGALKVIDSTEHLRAVNRGMEIFFC
jgi:hypothetical protein